MAERAYEEKVLKRSPDPFDHLGIDIICQTRIDEEDLSVNDGIRRRKSIQDL